MMFELWLLLTAVIFTGVGYFMAPRDILIAQTIDTLIEQGFLRYKKDKDNEIQILKWNDNEGQ